MVLYLLVPIFMALHFYVLFVIVLQVIAQRFEEAVHFWLYWSSFEQNDVLQWKEP